MRILLLTNVFPSPWHPTKGTFNFELARALARENDVRVVVPISWLDEWSRSMRASAVVRNDRTESRDGMTIHYPRYYYTPKLGRRWYHLFLWSSLKPTLERGLGSFRPQAVLGYWTHPDGTVAVKYARSIDAVAYVMVGGSDVLLSPEGSTRRRLVANTLRSADGVFTVSEDLRRQVVGLGVPAERAQVTYRGVDRTRFSPGDRSNARSRLGLHAESRLFLWVGRMEPVKGLDLLVQSAQILRQRGCRFQIILAGDGSERGRLERVVAGQGLSDYVRFVGKVPHSELPDWYRAADRTVLTSLSEGVPNVLLESHACGTPFISTRVGGVAEIAVDGVDRLVSPADSSEFADRMADILTAPSIDRDRLADRVASLDAVARTIADRMKSGYRPVQGAAMLAPAETAVAS